MHVKFFKLLIAFLSNHSVQTKLAFDLSSYTCHHHLFFIISLTKIPLFPFSTKALNEILLFLTDKLLVVLIRSLNYDLIALNSYIFFYFDIYFKGSISVSFRLL